MSGQTSSSCGLLVATTTWNENSWVSDRGEECSYSLTLWSMDASFCHLVEGRNARGSNSAPFMVLTCTNHRADTRHVVQKSLDSISILARYVGTTTSLTADHPRSPIFPPSPFELAPSSAGTQAPCLQIAPGRASAMGLGDPQA